MVFSVHNIIHDPPFSRLDLISCRNLLIYMRPSLQAKMYPLFHYALSKHGFLFLGNSESLGDFSHLFDVIDKKWKIFRATENFIANDLIANFTAMSPKTKTFAPLDIPIKQNILHPREAVERMMLDLHTPPALVVNERGEVIYIHGRTGKYLELAPGDANAVAADGLYEQLYIDPAELRGRIKALLRGRDQISLRQITEEMPLEKGLSELVAYFGIAAAMEQQQKAIINEEQSETIIYHKDGRDFRIDLPQTLFLA